MRLRWTPSAADDLASIHTYLSEHLPDLAQSTVRLIYSAVRSLRLFPGRGRFGEEPGTLEFVLPRLPYIIVYRTTTQVVEVIRIFHGAQDRRTH
jgi:plasmid stabilization system protein ParE